MAQKELVKDFRYEKKFVLTSIDKVELKHIIQHHPAMFSEIFYERQVNNIYFDSVELKNYYDNLAGVAQRFKVRIRWYGNLFGATKNPVLEFKIKDGLLGKKIIFKLKSFVLDENFNFKYLIKQVIKKSNLPKWVIETIKSSELVLIDIYKRKYFLSADKKYRTTIDSDFIFYRLHNSKNNFNEKVDEKETVILELKYSKEEDEGAQNISNHLPFRVTVGSKYIFGVNILEL